MTSSPLARRPRAVVFGYDTLGAHALDVVAELGIQVVAAVAPSNRQGLSIDVFAEHAAQRSIPLLRQPPRTRAAAFSDQLRPLGADLFVVWSYSMLLPAEVLSVPPKGCVNVHGGLLPEYRGAHVMQWAIINGECETGVTLHFMDPGFDTGPVIAQERFPIADSDDALSVREKLRTAGDRLLRLWLPRVAAGTAQGIPQDAARGHYYRVRTPEDGRIDWMQPATSVRNLVRALVRPWPGAFTTAGGQKLTVWRCALAPDPPIGSTPGTVYRVADGGVWVSTGSGSVILQDIDVEGLSSGTGCDGDGPRAVEALLGSILGT